MAPERWGPFGPPRLALLWHKVGVRMKFVGKKAKDVGFSGSPLPDVMQGVKRPDLGSLGFPLPDAKQGVKGPDLWIFDFPQY